ncbi:MAG: hypothetical protein KF791_13760 [Verrucomicrobiae bacterium]|nr:hypothetical protein [Verrucomicrobiae bacterium]
MESTTPFDLNEAIQRWREDLAPSPAFRSGDLDELESHLRDASALLQTRGLTEPEAFLIASRRLGRPETLALEFGKVHGDAVWRTRLLWMIAVAMLLVAALDVARIAAQAGLLIGSWATGNGFLQGWFGVAGQCVVLGLGLWLVRLATTGRLRLRPLAHPNPFWFKRPGLTVALLLTALVVLRGSAGLLHALAVGRLEPHAVGQAFLVMTTGHSILILLSLAALAVMSGALLHRQREGLHHGASLPLTTFLVLMLCGLPALAAEKVPAAPNQSADANAANATMDQAMESWRAGQKAKAVEQFVTVDFSKRPLFPAGSILNYSEAQFAALNPAAREKVSQPMLDDVQVIKQIAMQVTQAATDAQAGGNGTRASQYLAQVKRCGEALEHPNSLALLKLVGKALVRMSSGTPAPGR